MSGGYSRNRRALVGFDNQWVFVKEVDIALLSEDGQRELQWLAKDFAVTDYLRSRGVNFVPGWATLDKSKQVMLMSALRREDGWHWRPPTDPDPGHAVYTGSA